MLQPKIPLRTIPNSGIWNKIPSNDTNKNVSHEKLVSPEIARLKQLDHFELRTVCLEKYFEIFSAWAPVNELGDKSPHYPLVRSYTSASEDVTDHARLMGPYESWEQEVWEIYNPHDHDIEDEFGLEGDEADWSLEDDIIRDEL